MSLSVGPRAPGPVCPCARGPVGPCARGPMGPWARGPVGPWARGPVSNVMPCKRILLLLVAACSPKPNVTANALLLIGCTKSMRWQILNHLASPETHAHMSGITQCRAASPHQLVCWEMAITSCSAVPHSTACPKLGTTAPSRALLPARSYRYKSKTQSHCATAIIGCADQSVAIALISKGSRLQLLKKHVGKGN